MQLQFHDRDYYSSAMQYSLLPFRFLNWDDGRILVVNDVGERMFLPAPAFEEFVHGELNPQSREYLDLKGKHFLIDSDSKAALRLLALKYRTKKAHLEGFTKLHIISVTLRCEHSCQYCQVSRVSSDRVQYDMSEQTAEGSLDLIFRSPSTSLKIEFQGGEPLLHFERIQQIIESAELRAQQSGKAVEYVVATNLTLATDEMLQYFKAHNVLLSISLDGPAFIHDYNRPRQEGNSYDNVISKLALAKEVLGADRISALMTTTRHSLDHPMEIVDEYLRQGFTSIFLRSLNPFGYARKTAPATGYPIEDFLSFYRRALDHIIDINRNGTFFVETYAQLILTRLLTPFSTGYVDLQSPAGAGIGVAVYDYDGSVYVSDEARMLGATNDKTFCLGNVHTHSYEQMFASNLMKSIVEQSCIESLPGCSDCAFNPYCGADPVFNYATQRDMIGVRPSNDFHKKNFYIIKYLLSLYENDPQVREIFWSWINGGEG